MIIRCPKCGEKVEVSGLGRKPLNIPLKNVCEALQVHSSVAGAAKELGCSPAYIFKILKANRLKLNDILKGYPSGTLVLPTPSHEDVGSWRKSTQG